MSIMKQPLEGRFLHVLLLVFVNRFCCCRADGIAKNFSYFVSYRVCPMIRYIKQTDIWRDKSESIKGGKQRKKRMNILDYGAGGGVLAEALAKEGKDTTSVVAVDMYDGAVKAARKRLKPYPNAKAIKARTLWPRTSTSTPGTLTGLRKNHFDLVVSYRGALSPGTSMSDDRLHPFWALHSATKVCKNGGSVIIAELSKKPLWASFRVGYLGLLSAYYLWKSHRHHLAVDTPSSSTKRTNDRFQWLRRLGLAATGMIIGGMTATIGVIGGPMFCFVWAAPIINLIVPPKTANLQTSTITNKINALVSFVYYAIHCGDAWKKDSDTFAEIKSRMERVGLSNVKHHRQIVYRPQQRIPEGDLFKLSDIKPSTLHILQGTVNKKAAEYPKKNADMERSFRLYYTRKGVMQKEAASLSSLSLHLTDSSKQYWTRCLVGRGRGA